MSMNAYKHNVKLKEFLKSKNIIKRGQHKSILSNVSINKALNDKFKQFKKFSIQYPTVDHTHHDVYDDSSNLMVNLKIHKNQAKHTAEVMGIQNVFSHRPLACSKHK